MYDCDKKNDEKTNGGTGTDPVPLFWIAKPTALDGGNESSARRIVTMGWHPDIPDFRDKSLKHKDICKKLADTNSLITNGADIPDSVDHREWCSPVEDQGKLGSCTAQAVVGLMEYMMRRSTGEHVDGSRLFTYKVTRKLLGRTGDHGAYLRTAMHSVAAFGVPPEKHWPYVIENYEEEPSSFLYSFTNNYKALNYTRLDPIGEQPDKILDSLKRVLAAGYCAVFGFTVYSSLSNKADIPYPTEDDSVWGGHAVMAVGYDDYHKKDNSDKVVPSLIIKNSWGPGWGEHGYGYLPYKYVREGLARDFWTVFKWDWIDSGKFDGAEVNNRT